MLGKLTWESRSSIKTKHKGQITRSFIFFGGGGPEDHKLARDPQGYYNLGKSGSGTTLRWRDGGGDPSYHWGVSSLLHKREDNADNYYVVEQKIAQHRSGPEPEEFRVDVSAPTASGRR